MNGRIYSGGVRLGHMSEGGQAVLFLWGSILERKRGYLYAVQESEADHIAAVWSEDPQDSFCASPRHCK